MKNGLLIWNVLLTIVAGYLLYSQLGTKKNGANGKIVSTDTSAGNRQFRIAYFEMDSVEAHWKQVKDVQTELSRKEEDISLELDRMGKAFQQRYNQLQTQAQSGSLTQAQSEAASLELKRMDEQLKTTKASREQEYAELATRKTKDIKTKIKDFLKEYNLTKNYAFIATYGEADGLFYYKDSAYDITADVVAGLNNMYPSKPGTSSGKQ